MTSRDELSQTLRENPELAQVVAAELEALGYTVTPPVTVEPDEQGDIPYVAIGAGERAPWAHLSLNCPTCGQGPLPLVEGGSTLGVTLRYITHCGQTWLRGNVDVADADA